MSDLIYLRGTPKELKPIILHTMAMYQLLESKDLGTIYAYTNDKESVKRVGKPKVTLYFLEDARDGRQAINDEVAIEDRRTRGTIRFRLMNETTPTFSKGNANSLGLRIKEVFGSESGFVWTKGKKMFSYNDWEKGYQFQLLCRTEAEAQRIISAVMSLQFHLPDWKRLYKGENVEEALAYPTIPGKQIVLGEPRNLPQSRPNAKVRFQYSYVKLDGVAEPINLYDRTGTRPNAFVR